MTVMTFKSENLMDSIGQKILDTLQKDARISYTRLGQKVGLSAPAVTERVKKMEAAGIILGYHARIRKAAPENTITAFVELIITAAFYPSVRQKISRLPQVAECHHISGQAAFMLKVVTASVSELETVIAEFSPMGRTRTSIVMSSFKCAE